ncbi:MAG TPA: thiamine pyrophosphate-binding protein [Isosphaeraceae bacterium]|nr:thiamine pyrophosphate-binding protein [Isosphaeraceae bacterium]
MTGADLLVRLLKAQDVPFVSTLCGNGLDPILAACKRQGLRLADVRNEQAAGYMADAAGRLTRRVGVCTSSSGVAHMNALTGVVNAYFDGAPLLLITGASESRTAGMGNFQDLDHVALARPVCKLARRVDRPERIPLAVHEALATARSGRPGPVHLTIPGDVLKAPVADADLPRGAPSLESGGSTAAAPALAGVPAASAAVPATPPSLGDPELIREAVNLLARAERPLLVAGSGVFYAGAEAALRRLVETAGVPIVTPIWDRGSISQPMPEYLGVIGAASGGPPLLADADLILLAGSRVDYRVGYMKPPGVSAQARVVRIDRDPDELNQGVLPDVGILGDPSMVLDQLREQWQRRHLSARAGWLREAQSRNQRFRARWSQIPPASPMTGQHLVEALRGVLTDETLFLIDGGNIGQWAHVLLWDRYPGHWLTCGASAVVGWGLPAAIATKLIHPARPVLLLSGDGALGFTITELETAVRLRTPIVVLVADDQAWGIVASDQKRSLGEPIASLLGPVDYARVAQGFGARGVTVTRPVELAPAIRAAFASGEPTLIEVPIALRGPTD